MEPQATIALTGNPNAGKTTVFNALTGARQHVANYPGVTVEKKWGSLSRNGLEAKVVDLPGTYSLTAYSLDEVVARNFVVHEKPEVVVDVVDASNLERNLYLALQLIEMKANLVIALNMMDNAKARGFRIDTGKLSELLGVPVVPMVAKKGEGVTELIETMRAVVQGEITPAPAKISYGAEMDDAVTKLSDIIASDESLESRYPAKWLAIKLLEQDEELLEEIQDSPRKEEILEVVNGADARMDKIYGELPENIISDFRFGFISALCRKSVKKVTHERRTITDKIDKVVINRALGPVILFAILYGIYQFVFWISDAPVEWFETFFGWLGHLAESILPDGLVKSLVVSGIIDGVGGVLGFVPIILFMFFAIAILEDSGYMARIAFIMDRALKFFGLHGNSVLALIVAGGISGGCAVPGVMAARTLKSSKERLATILVAPFMNCGAKLPVYVLFIGAFFASKKGEMMFLLTLISWSLALMAAWILRKTILKGPSAPFVMELPPYRLPTLKGLLIHSWERTWMYVRKAGTVILAISVLLWALMTFPRMDGADLARYKTQEARATAMLKHSIAGRIGTGMETLTRPLGFDYRTNIALIGGFAAKEVVVATLGTAYSLGEVNPEGTDSLSQRLAREPGFSPLKGFALMLFVMLYSPCLVTVAVMKKETGGWKWPLFAMVHATALAYLVALVVVQGGRLLGLG